jgi:acetylcholinesterase
MADYLIRFVSKLDPNGDTAIPWPQYTTGSPDMLTFNDGLTPLVITQDTYRANAIKFLTTLALSNPI